MSPELRDFSAGNEVSVDSIIASIEKITDPICGFTISGGEPFEQPKELNLLVSGLSEKYGDDIIIYTGYSLEELKRKDNEDINSIIEKISVLVDGRYVRELNDEKGLRGSSNQVIHIFKNRKLYEYMNDCQRSLQIFNYQIDNSLLIGIF